jgi:hypothetical protein
MLSLFEATIQANLANNVMFMSLFFLNPSPLLFFGMHILSQAFKAKYLLLSFFFFFLFHQNLLVMLSRLSQILEGISKYDIEYDGIDWATYLIIVHRPAKDKHLPTVLSLLILAYLEGT